MDTEVLTIAAQDLLDETGERLLALLKMGTPDEAATPAIGLLVALLRAGSGTAAEDATAAIRTLASRGTHGDSLREAGAIPHLVGILRDPEGACGNGIEHAAGALAHLCMQRAANREALFAAGGVPVLQRLLETEGQAAEYAASTLGALALCGAPPARAAVHTAVNELAEGAQDRMQPPPRASGSLC